MNKADNALKRGRYNKARRLYISVLANNPDNLDALLGLAESLYRLKKYKGSIIEIEKLLSIQPAQVRAHQLKSYVLAHQKRYKESEDEIRNALSLSPNSVESLRFLAGLLLLSGNSAGSLSLLQKAIELNPRDWHVHYDLGLVYNAQKSFQEANRECKLAYKLHPSFNTFFALVELFIYLNRPFIIIGVFGLLFLSALTHIRVLDILLDGFSYLTGIGYLIYRRWVPGVVLIIGASALLAYVIFFPI